VIVRRRRVRLRTFELIEEIDRAAQMRNHDGAADDEADAEHLEEFVAIDAGLAALRHVIRDAVVAAQHHRRDETEHLLGLHVERAALVSLRIEREEAPYDLIVLSENPLVHALAELGELTHAIVAHASLPSSSARRPLRSAATRSSCPPTWCPLMKICGTVRRPPLRASISSRLTASVSMRISLYSSPLALSTLFAATQ
jgi:hypothetical protein